MVPFNSTLPPLRSIIKVCGMREPANIEAVSALMPELMGIIFYPKSPRYAGSIDSKTIQNIISKGISPVGVFVNAPEEEVIQTCVQHGIRIVQLHGHESPTVCNNLRGKGFTVIKALGIEDRPDWDEMRMYENAVDLFIFDTKSKDYGGTGRKFHWHFLQSYPLKIPFLLSGGIGPEDSEAIRRSSLPMMIGVDLNSRFESSPGIKDPGKLQLFISDFRTDNIKPETDIITTKI